MTTIHRCSECNHQSANHGYSGGWSPRIGPCCYGGCACRMTPEQVVALGNSVEIPTWPGYDHASGKWAAS